MELMIEKLLGFVLVVTRLSAFFLVLPVFGWKSIPMRIKASMTILTGIFFSMITRLPFDASKIHELEAALLIANEALYGLALGLTASVVFSAVKLSGRIIERQMGMAIIERQMGMAMAQVMDPLTGERAQPLSSLLEMIFIILFLSANGHHLLLLIIARSYESFPLGRIPEISLLAGGVIKAGSVMLLAGLRMAAPLLAAFLLLMVVLGVLARVVPEMNILFISLPLRVGLGLLMVVIFLPLISKFVSEFAGWMGEVLVL